MKKALILFFVIDAIFFLGIVLYVVNGAFSGRQNATIPSIPVPKYIAHAGGGVRNLANTNSLEAFDANFRRGHRFFEIDLNWTIDDQLVLIHDWQAVFEDIFRQSKDVGVPSVEEFLQIKMKADLTPMSFAGLAKWLRAHPDARIVTDIKDNNLRALQRISKEYPDLVERIIPQVYAFEEYEPVWNMGYRNIILTLYVNDYPDEAVLGFAQSQKPFGITMTAERAMGPLPKQLGKIGIPVFAHTVNSSKQKRELEANGVNGIYTDYLFGGK